MMNTELSGPYRLVYDEITFFVRTASKGVYMLGQQGQSNRFLVSYVGAGFTDVRSELLDRIGTASMFKLQLTPSADAAFSKQCDLFHQFQPSGNFVHPERPRGSSAQCPYCALPKTAVVRRR
ncbi:MAG: hypothetical protein C0511_03890 [Hyphomicrobium sp.]|nr:hypothetical protein [Hyphomicrobium sp.]